MDEQRFDQIAKRLGQSRTRRSAVKGLGGALLGAAGLATGLEAAATGKHQRHGASGRVAVACGNQTCSPDEICIGGGRADIPQVCCNTAKTCGGPDNNLKICCTSSQTCTGDIPNQTCANTCHGQSCAQGEVCIGGGRIGTTTFPQVCCASGKTCGGPQDIVKICCASSQTCTGTLPNQTCQANTTCVPANGACDVNHPCCQPDQFHCSSTTTTAGACVANTTCTGVLCPPDPRGQRKCCPAGHPCNPNPNGTYNCGLGHGGRSRHGRSRNRR